MHSTQFEARNPAFNRMLEQANLGGFFTSSRSSDTNSIQMLTKLITLVSINKHDGQKPTSVCKYSGKLNQRQLIYLVASLLLNTEDEN
jgi:hypothetical protein